MAINPRNDLTYYGPFQTQGTTWRIIVRPIEQRAASFSHTQLLTKAVADLQRTERRDARRGVAHNLFNLPPTHEFIVDIVASHDTNVVHIPVRIKGGAVHSSTGHRLSEAEQIRRIAKFWAFLLMGEEGKGHKVSWQYVIPGYTAYFFWANALLSRYCDFWGIE